MKSAGFSCDEIKVSTRNGRDVTVLEPFTYTTLAGEVLTVAAGVESDGASTPQVLWSTGLAPFGIYWPGAVVHDNLYRYQGRPKEFCDDVLREIMQRLGVDRRTEEIIYSGVYLGGQQAYDEDQVVRDSACREAFVEGERL